MATIDIPDKICPHCGGITYRVQVSGKYTSSICVIKLKESKKIYYELNKHKLNEDNKRRYAESDVHKKVEEKRKYLSELKDRTCRTCNETKSIKKFRKISTHARDTKCISCRAKEKFTRDCTELKDVYIKAAVKFGTNLSSKDIPQKLIDIKRKQLLLTRKLKQLQNEKDKEKGN